MKAKLRNEKFVELFLRVKHMKKKIFKNPGYEKFGTDLRLPIRMPKIKRHDRFRLLPDLGYFIFIYKLNFMWDKMACIYNARGLEFFQREFLNKKSNSVDPF